jgi:GNAT superfamily N-acetyltransferase
VADRPCMRPFVERDVDPVVDLLQAAFGRWPSDLVTSDPAGFFRWKHLRNPHGRSSMLVAEDESGLVGFRALLPVLLGAGDRPIRALRGADLAVVPAKRGRGIAAALVEQGTRCIPPDVSFTFSNANRMSRSGLRRLGRRQAGRMPRYVRLIRPLRVGRALRTGSAREPHSPAPPVSAPAAATVLADHDALSSLLARIDRPEGRIVVTKDVGYLRWRYGAFGDYHAVVDDDGRHLHGLCIFRVAAAPDGWTGRVCELLVARGDRRRARRLLHRTIRSVAVDYFTCSFPSGSSELSAARRSGFVRVPGGEELLVYPLARNLAPDPEDQRSWALTRGDLELL